MSFVTREEASMLEAEQPEERNREVARPALALGIWMRSQRGVVSQLSMEGLWTVEERGSGESEGSREEEGWELVEEGRGSASP